MKNLFKVKVKIYMVSCDMSLVECKVRESGFLRICG